MAKPSFSITAMQLSDVPDIAQLGADSFQGDRHTEMKALGREPYDHKQTMLNVLPGILNDPRLVCLKAVDELSGKTMGYCVWGFHGFEPDQIPYMPGRVQSDELPATQETEDATQHEEQITDDPIKRLNAKTSADMAAWVEEVMPPGVQCLYVVMLSVSPTFQRHGVGSALLRWGLVICDKHGVFAWVHSSNAAHTMYTKLGFCTMKKLDINLDDYAPCPPPNEKPGASWGRYMFRYMMYMPRKAD